MSYRFLVIKGTAYPVLEWDQVWSWGWGRRRSKGRGWTATDWAIWRHREGSYRLITNGDVQKHDGPASEVLACIDDERVLASATSVLLGKGKDRRGPRMALICGTAISIPRPSIVRMTVTEEGHVESRVAVSTDNVHLSALHLLDGKGPKWGVPRGVRWLSGEDPIPISDGSELFVAPLPRPQTESREQVMFSATFWSSGKRPAATGSMLVVAPAVDVCYSGSGKVSFNRDSSLREVTNSSARSIRVVVRAADRNAVLFECVLAQGGTLQFDQGPVGPMRIYGKFI